MDQNMKTTKKVPRYLLMPVVGILAVLFLAFVQFVGNLPTIELELGKDHRIQPDWIENDRVIFVWDEVSGTDGYKFYLTRHDDSFSFSQDLLGYKVCLEGGCRVKNISNLTPGDYTITLTPYVNTRTGANVSHMYKQELRSKIEVIPDISDTYLPTVSFKISGTLASAHVTSTGIDQDLNVFVYWESGLPFERVRLNLKQDLYKGSFTTPWIDVDCQTFECSLEISYPLPYWVGDSYRVSIQGAIGASESDWSGERDGSLPGYNSGNG